MVIFVRTKGEKNRKTLQNSRIFRFKFAIFSCQVRVNFVLSSRIFRVKFAQTLHEKRAKGEKRANERAIFVRTKGEKRASKRAIFVRTIGEKDRKTLQNSRILRLKFANFRVKFA